MWQNTVQAVNEMVIIAGRVTVVTIIGLKNIILKKKKYYQTGIVHSRRNLWITALSPHERSLEFLRGWELLKQNVYSIQLNWKFLRSREYKQKTLLWDIKKKTKQNTRTSRRIFYILIQHIINIKQ